MAHKHLFTCDVEPGVKVNVFSLQFHPNTSFVLCCPKYFVLLKYQADNLEVKSIHEDGSSYTIISSSSRLPAAGLRIVKLNKKSIFTYDKKVNGNPTAHDLPY